MERLPLLRYESTDAVLAFRDGKAIRVAQFLQDTAEMASALASSPCVLNACTDRYLFAVGLAAALVRGQTTLLMPARVPQTWDEIARQHPGHCEISDTAISGRPMDAILCAARVRPAGNGLTDLAFPADQIAAIAYTSGTTGRQMPHPKRWGSLVSSTRAVGERLGLARSGAAVILSTVPHQHMYGLESAILLALQHGIAIATSRPFYASDVSASLATLPRPRILVTTPIHLRSMVEDAMALPPADMLICATAPLSPQLAAAAEARFGAPLQEIYGCSECGQLAVRRTVATAEWECLGGFRLHQDARGTVVTTSSSSDETVLADVIELRSPTRFLLHGRTADLVNIGGKRTSLSHLDYHLNSIEGVRDGVFIMPDESGARITRLIACVVGTPGLTAEFVMSQLRERIDAAFLPRRLRFVETLPRDGNGKVTRAALNDLAVQVTGR